MTARTKFAHLLSVALVGVLVSGLMATTSAGAVMSSAAAANWKRIWTKKIQPRADQRYHTKAASDAAYATKAQSAAAAAAAQSSAEAATVAKLGSYYTKAESDARAYSKAESDTRYRSQLGLIRGNWALAPHNSVAFDAESISYGVTLSAAPTLHYIPWGGALPAGCSGSFGAPGADPGNLCVFEVGRDNVSRAHFLDSTMFGVTLYAAASSTGPGMLTGTYALKPAAVGTGPNVASSAMTPPDGLPR